MAEKPFEFFPQYVKQDYRRIFRTPSAEPWHTGASWSDGYYRAAKAIVEGVVSRAYRPTVEGIPAVFLFRHYLELALKYLIFHARRLRDARTLAEPDEVEAIKKTHSLKELWECAQRECQKRIPRTVWEKLDTAFVDCCIAEFEAADPQPGDTFRYYGKQFATGEGATTRHPVDFAALLCDMEHVYDVLEAIDSYVFETYGQIEDSMTNSL